MMSSVEYQNRGGFRVWAPFSLNNAFIIRSARYQKLPEQPLQLSVLKLDGSSFCVNVARNATVAELKLAIQRVFDVSCEGEGKVLWSLVWSHFCLCYESQKLTNDKACIRNFGIRDGDQVQFVRQMMIETAEYETAKQQSRSESNHPDKYSVINICEADENDSACPSNQQTTYFEIEEEKREEEAISNSEFNLAQFVKGWLAHPKFWYSKGKGLRESNRPSMFPFHCFRS
nr:U11/U12 small nuclear ribonucleoprotein 25 kDa protein-like isoform X1 [Ipomoea batatas]